MEISNGSEIGSIRQSSAFFYVFSPVLFLIYLDDIDTGLTYKVSDEFADDTKIMM